MHPQTQIDAEKARAGEIVAPSWRKAAFHCPYCMVFTQMKWEFMEPYDRKVDVAICQNCSIRSIWNRVGDNMTEQGYMVWPDVVTAPMAHIEMSASVSDDYNEARSVVNRSPRAAAALLRLALQKLTVELGEPGKNLNDDIGALVKKKGLPVRIQQALDTLRVNGNNAVHPGEIDLRDDADTATALFNILNYIVDQLIAQPKALEALYGALPAGAREAIEKRDAEAD